MEPENLPEKLPHAAKPITWQSLKNYTNARIALGHVGTSLPLSETLQFKLAHANARDAVYSELQAEKLVKDLEIFGLPVLQLQSQVQGRKQYLQRPDLGRKLQLNSIEKLIQLQTFATDIAIILADGLSATAINEHALPVLQLLIPKFKNAGFSLAPFTLIKQGRVAIGDEIGQCLKAKLVIMLIGERPGLSAPDSMGAYFTFDPKPGITDRSRNCISNIRPAGLPYDAAAEKIFYLAKEALRLKLTGVELKDDFGLLSNENFPELEV